MAATARILTFGEAMLRLSPAGSLRFPQAIPGPLSAEFGGAELNVASALAEWGIPVSFLTAMPQQHPVTVACRGQIRRAGIDDSLVKEIPEGGRFGTYYIEYGAAGRDTIVTYDRAGSAFAVCPPSAYDWPRLLSRVSWLHVTGISPGVSQSAAMSVAGCLSVAANAGIPVSCDLNYRSKLWRWDGGNDPRRLARSVMQPLLSHLTLLVASADDAETMLGLSVPATGDDRASRVADARRLARLIAASSPRLKYVAIPLRETVSANHARYGAVLYDRTTDEDHVAPLSAAGEYEPLEVTAVVDRLGAGDALGAGIIYGLQPESGMTPAEALAFGVAACVFKHGIWGDLFIGQRAEVEALLAGRRGGRIQR